MKSLLRNLKNLELAVARTKGEDPRHIYYLAKAYFDMNTPENNEKAIPLIHRYLNGDEKGNHKSGWPEERQQGWEYLSELYRRKGEHNNAMKAVLNSFTEPSEPQPELFLSIALSHIHKQQYELALFWAKIASTVEKKKTTLVTNERDIQARTLEILYNACLNLAKVDQAHAAATKLLELFPDMQSAKDAYELIDHIKVQRDMTQKVAQIAEYLEQNGEGHKLVPLLQAAPAIAEETPFIQEIAQKVNPPRVWGTDEIMIYCGLGFTDWSPKRLSDPKDSFIGGSEEAVIRMSAELQKQGWKVTVYGSPGEDQGEHDGVMWLPYFKFNRRDEFNVVISWRQIGFFDLDFKAKKTYLWNHDIINQLEVTPERLAKIDKLIVLSQFHRENIPNVPDEKIFISSNGI
jgi:tetratricopeptide (TPR) repeat protein